MLNLFLVIALGTASPNLRDQQRMPDGAITRRQPVDSVEEARRRLAAEPSDVRLTYEKLLLQDRRDRVRTYGNLPSSLKSAIWIHKSLLALAQHEEFTEEQRAVIYDAITLFTPELFDITFPSPDWVNRVDLPLRKLAQRAKIVLGFKLAAQLFAQLEPEMPTVSVESVHATAHPQLGHVPEDLPYCSCSTSSDYCAETHGNDWYCLGGGCVWGTNWGCGSVFAYPCDGLCDLKQFQN